MDILKPKRNARNELTVEKRARWERGKKLFEYGRRAWNFDSIRFFKRVNVCASACAYVALSVIWDFYLTFHFSQTSARRYTCIESSQENIHNQTKPYYITNYKIPSRCSKHDHLFCALWFFPSSFLFFYFFLFVFMVKFVFLFFCSFHFWLLPDLSIYLCEFNCMWCERASVRKSWLQSVAVQADDDNLLASLSIQIE